MTVTQLLQLYAPLAGLLAVTFWLGVLSNRMKVAENRQTRVEQDLAAQRLDAVTLGVLVGKFDILTTSLNALDKELRELRKELAHQHGNTFAQGHHG